MIFSAKNNKIKYSNLPNLSNPIKKWFQNIEFGFITKSIVDFEAVETIIKKSFVGVVQNLDSKQLQVKPEAQRSWSWKMIHCLPDLVLDVDEKIEYEGETYRVMNIRDFKEYGYLEYHIVRDFDNGNN
jgi:hypothetical protein